MFQPLRQFIKQYLNFSSKDRNGIIVLLVIILILIVANIITNNINQNSKFDYTELVEVFEKWEAEKTKENNSNLKLFDFNPNTITIQRLDSLNLPKFVKNNILNYRAANGKFVIPEDLLKIYGMSDSIFQTIEKYITIPVIKKKEKKEYINYETEKELEGFFDPNYADLNQLRNFGFSQFQANNILGYRAKGGTFYSKNDLLKIYGVDSSFFTKIENHIVIEKTEEIEPEEVDESNIIEINKADSLQLINLEGIGPVFASRILKYRNLLGGFVSKRQLLEVYNFPEETYLNIEDNLQVDEFAIRKLRVNFAEYSDLLRHPYLNKEQVSAILSYRNSRGPINTIEQLGLINKIDSLTLNRMKPYISVQ